MTRAHTTDRDPSATDGNNGHDGSVETRSLANAPIAEAVDRACTVLSTRVQRDPYATIGIAVGLGLLVGGGMWRLFARSLVGLGTRIAVTTVVTSLLESTSTETRQEPKK